MKIAVDLAHGFPKDRGNVGIIAEEEVINEVGIYLIKKLRELNQEVILSRPLRNHKNDAMTKRSLLKTRICKCNDSNVDLVISIHASVGMGSGFDVYTHHGRSFTQCDGIINNLKHLGFISRGIKNGSEMYMIKATKAKVIILNVCFIDTLYDVNKFNKIGGEAIGYAIAFGILNMRLSSNIDEAKSNPILNDWVYRLKDEIIVQGYKDFKESEISQDQIIKYAPKVSFGARGNITKLIQEKLNINIDGVFGNETRNTLVEFQKNKNISITGIVDMDTWLKFMEIDQN